MPKFLEKRLEAEGKKKGLKGKKLKAYIYGAMNNIGAMKGNKETAKGRNMAKKHKRDTSRTHIIKLTK